MMLLQTQNIYSRVSSVYECYVFLQTLSDFIVSGSTQVTREHNKKCTHDLFPRQHQQNAENGGVEVMSSSKQCLFGCSWGHYCTRIQKNTQCAGKFGILLRSFFFFLDFIFLSL